MENPPGLIKSSLNAEQSNTNQFFISLYFHSSHIRTPPPPPPAIYTKRIWTSIFLNSQKKWGEKGENRVNFCIPHFQVPALQKGIFFFKKWVYGECGRITRN